jgi:cytochrome c-type protein NapB
MKRTFFFLFTLICLGIFAVNGSASEHKGDAAPAGAAPAAGMDWQAGDSPIPRTFDHQPPLVPHTVTEYEITAAKNDCLECHGTADSGAPALHASHYLDRDNKKSDKVAAQWYFCNQCHVGQVDAKPLVENTFQGK